MIQIGQAATQNDGIGIQEIDDLGEATGCAIGMPGERSARLRVTGNGASHNLACVTGARTIAIFRQSSPGDARFQAVMLTAPT